MKLKYKILIICGSLSLIIFLIFPPKYLMQIIKLKMRNPINEAVEDYNKGEYRYIGVYGYAGYAPGVNHIIASKNTIKYYMPYTSDVIDGFLHKYLIEHSTEYAKQHNLKLIQLLSTTKENHTKDNAARDDSHP